MADSERGEEGRSTLLTGPEICYEDRYQGYKMLIQDIAERLGPEDVRFIAFNQDLPAHDNHRQPAALEVLQQLERHGLFSHSKIQPLVELLKSIHRNDLVNKHVEPYRIRYGYEIHVPKGRHSMPELASATTAVRRSHSLPSQVNQRITVVEEKRGHAIQETGEVPSQASYYIPETSANSLQYRLHAPAYPTETLQSSSHMSQQQIPQFNTHRYTHMRTTNKPVAARPSQPGVRLSQSYQILQPPEGFDSTTTPSLLEESRSISHIPEFTGAHSRYSEQISSQMSSTPILNQLCTTLYHPSFENIPIGVPAKDYVPAMAFVQSPFSQPQQIITSNLTTQGSRVMDYPELPSDGSSQIHASQSGYHSSLSGAQMMPEQYRESISDSMHSIASNPPRRANTIPSIEQQNAAYWYQSPPSNEDLLQAQRDQHFECSPAGPGLLTGRESRSLPPVSSYSALQQSGYYKPTVHQNLPGTQSSFEGMQFHPNVRPEGHIRSLTPTRSIGKRSTSVPENYLRRSIGSVNRIHHAPGFHTPQHIHRTNFSSRSSIAASDSGIDVQNLKSPSQTSAMGIQIDTVVENSPGIRTHQPSDNPYTEVLPTHHETVDALDSRMRRLQMLPYSIVAYNSSESCDTEQSPLRGPRSGSPRKRFKHRRRSWGPNTHEMQWPLKRNDLNKIVYEHKTEKCLKSAEKLELEYAEAKANPKLAFRLYPYGLEEDYGKNATLEIKIKIPAKRCPRLPTSAKVSLTVTAWDCKEERCLNSVAVEKPMNLRQFTIPEFITHAALKESRSDYIEIQAFAELIGLTVEPQ